MQLTAALSIYSPANRRRLLLLAAAIILGVALVDWWTEPYISLGFLYLFPVMIAGGFLTRTQIVGLAFFCAMLQEVFSNLPASDAWTRLIFSSAGFMGTGFFISELIRNRRIAIEHLQELERQVQLRRDAEEQLQVLVGSSPAAIITIDAEGTILLANEAAQQMLAPGGSPLTRQNAGSYLPALVAAVQSRNWQRFRTTLQCRGQRSNGEVFLAAVWFSTYSANSTNRLAAIILDMSEDLRNREDLNLDYLLKNTRILMSAVSHEIRNLCGAASVVHRNLTKVGELRGNADFEALGTLIQGLEKISAMELRGSVEHSRSAVDLPSLFDELRVLIESSYHELGISVRWETGVELPLVWADRYGLLQVFLNLAKNSRRAMETVATRQLSVSTAVQDDSVIIRFEDTGVGVTAPQNLFRPFQRDAQATGLGLYISRALLKSFGGDLRYEQRDLGCCFAVVLQAVRQHEATPNV